MDLKHEIIETIKSNIEKKIDITLKTNLEELELDSFGTLIIIDAFEQKFNITINNENFLNLKTVNDIAEKIKDYKNV